MKPDRNVTLGGGASGKRVHECDEAEMGGEGKKIRKREKRRIHPVKVTLSSPSSARNPHFLDSSARHN